MWTWHVLALAVVIVDFNNLMDRCTFAQNASDSHAPGSYDTTYTGTQSGGMPTCLPRRQLSTLARMPHAMPVASNMEHCVRRSVMSAQPSIDFDKNRKRSVLLSEGLQHVPNHSGAAVIRHMAAVCQRMQDCWPFFPLAPTPEIRSCSMDIVKVAITPAAWNLTPPFITTRSCTVARVQNIRLRCVSMGFTRYLEGQPSECCAV